MRKLDVIVKTCPYSTGSIAIKNGHHITVGIPESNHENAIRIHKEFSGWKIELSHTRPGFGKPYLLNLTNQEKDDKIKISIVPQRDFIKTNLMDCTFKSLKQFTLTGPNITTNKSQTDNTTSGMKLELVSYGTLRISSHPLQVKEVLARVIPKEGCTDVGNIYVDTEAVLKCTTFETNVDVQGDVFINGTVTCGLFDKENCLTVKIGTGDLHVNVDGVLGQEVDATTSTNNANLTKRLNVAIENGNLTNFGSLCAQDYLKLKSNNIMLCSDSKHDTAQRGFYSFISLQKELGHLNDIAARPKKESSFNDSRMFRAVQSLDCDNFISIVNEEIDPAVRVNGRSIQDELHAVCGGGNHKDNYDEDQHKKEIIRGGLAMCEWRHGVIRAAVIECIVYQDIYDCSQLQGGILHFDVGGSARVVKPWTWISGTISGLVRGDLLFYDNAMLRSFNQFHVLGNVRISKTSAVWVKEGGKLYCGEVFENKNVIVSEGNFGLDLGELKQDREGAIISNGDLLLALRDGQENSWFGYVCVDRHLFIQLEKKVSCDAECIATECDVEFFGSNAQLVINEILMVKEGDLSLEATDTSEAPNFVLFGKLHAKGINGITASVSSMPGAIADLTCAWNGKTEPHTVDVITRCLEISADSLMTCSGPRDKDNNVINWPISTSVSSEEKMSVHGKLQAFAMNLGIQARSLNNSGEITLSPGTKTKSLISSSLCITCEKAALNSGTIRCDGDLIITSETLSNEKGVIKSSPNLGIDISSTDETTLSGQIYVDKYLYVHSQSHKEFSFCGLGGKGEISGTFVLPDKFEVTCEKGHLAIDSTIASSEVNIQPECVFSLSKRLKWHKVSHLGKIFVEFHRSENTNSAEIASAFIVEDSFHANHLSIRCVKEDVPTTENVVFQGASKSIVIHNLYIDKSIAKVTFNTDNIFKCSEVFILCELATIISEIECVNLEANSIHVPGRMRCVQPAEEEKPSTIIVDETFQLSGCLECVGFVEVNAGKTFVQENAEVGGIDVLQTLKIITAEDGLVSLGGLITGNAESVTSLEIEAKDIIVSGSMTNVSDLKLTAEKKLHLTEKGRIFSCETVEIKGEWITMAGSIEEFLTLQIEPWALLNYGKIESALEESNVCLSSCLALVNSGICRGQVTSLEAPFLLSLPGKEISGVNDVTSCELVGRERIRLESITCFLGGSTLKSNKLIENDTVLLFKFLAYVSCTPDAKSLEAWSKAAESLKNIQSEYRDNEGREISNSLKSLKKGSMASAEIGIRIAQMYSMVNSFVADVLKNGIESFDVPRLVFIITSESERYTKINILKEKLLAIPHKARKLRQWMKKKGIKGVESIMKRFGFSESKRKSNKTEGILESGLCCLSEGVTSTDSAYEALFDEVFCDEGVLSAGDVVVASKEIVMTKREKKAIAMMMFADNVCKAGDITSDSLVIKSEGKAQLVGKIKSDNTTIEAKSGIDLAYHDKPKGKYTADHHFKNLTLKTDKMNQVNDLLKGEGLYEDLRISDQLDLAVTDQDILLSRCNIDQLYKLKLEAKSVNIDNARVHCEKGVSITSHQSLDVSDSSISSRDSTILRSTEGNVSMDSSHVEATDIAAVMSNKGSISMTGGSISGDQGAVLKAQKDIIVDPIETRHSSSSSRSGFFSSSKDSCSYSTVSKARISSKCGNVAIVSEEGSVKATATEISAAKNIAISAKKDVVIQDKVTIRKEEHVRSNWFHRKREVKRTEEQHCSTLAAGGSLSISSRDSNVSVIGSDCQVRGDMMVKAAGTVQFKDRILSRSEESHSSGISFSLEKGLSIGAENRRLHHQRLAGRKTEVGGNFIVTAENFDVKNAMAMDVGNMIIDAKNVNFEGAELHNTSSMTKWSLDIGMNQLGISVGKSRSREKKVINQSIKVRGRTHFTNAQKVNLTACNLETDAISGNIGKLNVISKQSEIEAFDSSTSIGFTMVEGFPVPNKFGKSQSSDVGQFVEKPSGIHCRGSINQDEFQVGSLKLRGSSVTADGAIGNFAKNIISEKVHSYRSQSSSGFSIGVDKTGVELGMHASNKSMSMEHEATISSSSGIVSEEIKKSVNTDFSKHSRITKQHSSAFGINLRVAKDGVGAGLQTNDTSIGLCASKNKVGVTAQHGDKGFSLSGGKSGFSGSVQDGENSVGLGLSKKNFDLSVKTKDSAIGTSLRKGGISASVEHKGLSIAASTSEGTKSLQAKVGDFEAGLTRDKNQATGNKSTSASLKIADMGISGSTSKDMKGINFHVKDFKTEIKSERNPSTGKKTFSGNLKVRDLELGGTNSKHAKSFQLKKGDFETKVTRNKDANTGKKTTSANLRAKDLELDSSTSKDSKSVKVKKGNFQTAVRQEKDAKNGNKTTSASLKAGDLELAGSTSKDSQSFDLKAGNFKTGVKREKNADTGNNTVSDSLKAGDLKVGGSTSKDFQAFDLKSGDFQTGVKREKDADTGNNTVSV